MDEPKPSYLQDDILKYLEEQQKSGDTCEEYTQFLKSDSAIFNVRSILEEIVKDVERRERLKKVYEAKLREHNQYELFDLSKIIPNFHIDDALYEKMTFRETLVISTFENSTHDLQPIPVGGLCLDIQKATGNKPFRRIHPSFEQDMIEAITLKIQADIDAARRDPCKWNAKQKENESDVNSDDGSGGIGEESVKMEMNQSGELAVGEEDLTPSMQDLLDYKEFLNNEMKQEYCKFLVHLSSQFEFRGSNGGSRITTWADRNLHTLEEKRREYVVDIDKNLSEKTLYIALQQKRYFLKHTSTPDNISDRKYYSTLKAKDLICEGTNFLLMRYLAIKRYVGTFELSTTYINGDMCRNIYDCKGPESGIVNYKKLDLCKIYRVIIEECGIKHKCCTVLTLSGQIVKQDWKWCEHVLHLNPYAVITNDKPMGNEHLLLSKNWRNDMQLFSEFLDQKNVNFLKIKSYLLDHPELKDMLGDYVQLILLMKPQSILDFTINHFLHFAPELLPRNEYLDAEEIENSGHHFPV